MEQRSQQTATKGEAGKIWIFFLVFNKNIQQRILSLYIYMNLLKIMLHWSR